MSQVAEAMTKAKVGGRVQQRFVVGGGSFVIEGMYEKLAPVGTHTTAYLYSVEAYKHSSSVLSC